MTILKLCLTVSWEILDSTKATKQCLGEEKQGKKITRWNVGRFASNETEVRALVEGQLLAKRLHAERIGFKLTPDTRILVTGGASVNLAILQVGPSSRPTTLSVLIMLIIHRL